MNKTMPKQIKSVIKINLPQYWFLVQVNQTASIRKIKRQVKILKGYRMIDQVLSLPSGRELQDRETVDAILVEEPSIRKQGLILSIVPGDPTKVKADSMKSASNTELAVTTVTKTQAVNETSVVIKLSFGCQHRRFPFEQRTVSYERLTDLCTQFFGIKNVYRMIFSYIDEDGDRVQFSTDDELAYVLAHHTQRSGSLGTPVLKLSFSVKPVAVKPPAADTNVPSPNSDNIEDFSSKCVPLSFPSHDEPMAKSSPANPRMVQDGDVIVLQAERDGAFLNLVFNKKEGKVVANRSMSSDVHKDAKWVVEKVSKTEKDTSSEDACDVNGSIFFLSCKNLDEKRKEQASREKTNLRVLPNGEVNHNGGRGVFARFEILVSNDGKVSLRSVGRSKANPNNSFLGIAKVNKQFVVNGKNTADSEEAKFLLKFMN